jgi:hypothetical protein
MRCVAKRALIVLASFVNSATLFSVINNEHDISDEAIYRAEKIRAFERQQLPFLRSMFDFDIVIEIGYAEEQEQPLTLKQLLLLNICSRATIRRKLVTLTEQGIVIRRTQAKDHRASLLMISPTTVKLLGKYGGTIASISVSHFK